jgi:hypothetical protein
MADVMRGDVGQPRCRVPARGPQQAGVQEMLGDGHGPRRGAEKSHDLVDARADPPAGVDGPGVGGEDITQRFPVSPVDGEAVTGEHVADLGPVRLGQLPTRTGKSRERGLSRVDVDGQDLTPRIVASLILSLLGIWL